MPVPAFTIQKLGPWLHTIDINLPNLANGQEVRLFIPGDIHHDNNSCERNTLHKHLQRACDEGAIIISIGDQFCAMQGRYDPRRSRKGIRPEDNYDDYVDRIVRHFAEDLIPYCKNWALMGLGNHETSILKNLNTDLVARACERFRAAGSQVEKGNYMGMIRIRLKDADAARTYFTYNIYYHHGYGGNAPVTGSLLGLKRHKVFIEGVDLLVMGHKHSYIYKPEKVMRFGKSGDVEFREVDMLAVDSYKGMPQPTGWAVEKGFAPPTIGGSMITLRTERWFEKEKRRNLLRADITRIR